MRTTANFLTLCVATALALAPLPAFAAPHTHANQLALSLLGQFGLGGNTAEAGKWLSQAREAMNNGDLELAQRYVERAEQLNPKYDPLTARFKDTPEKVRKDLAKLQANPVPPAAPPSRSFELQPPAGGNVAPADPFAIPSQTPSDRIPNEMPAGSPSFADAAGPTSLPPSMVDRVPLVGEGAGRRSSFASALAGPDHSTDAFDERMEKAVAPGADRQAQSDALLHEARRALAHGDPKQAAAHVERARQLGVVYPLHADYPDKIEQLIRRAGELAGGPAAGTDRSSYDRDYAQLLLDQAEGLLRYRDVLLARQLALQAKSLGAQFRPFERTPEVVLQKVEAQLQAGGPGQAAVNYALSDRPDPSQVPAAGQAKRLPPVSPAAGKDEALRLVAMARAALDRGDVSNAHRFAQQAQDLRVPDTAFGGNETRPWEILLEVNRHLTQSNRSPVAQASYEEEAGPAPTKSAIRQGLYQPQNDSTRVALAQADSSDQQPGEAEPASPGVRLYRQGLEALAKQDRSAALQLFERAWQYEAELDPATRQQLQDKLTRLRVVGPADAAAGQPPSTLEQVDTKQQILFQKLYAEVTSEQRSADKLVADGDPKGALGSLQKLRDRVGQSELEPAAKKQLLTLVDRSVNRLEQFIEQNSSRIELDERNAEVLADVEADRARTGETQNKLAEMVEEFNALIDEHRYAEAEVIAKQAREIDPESEVVQNLLWKSKFARRIAEYHRIAEAKEDGFAKALSNVDESSAPFDDNRPLQFGGIKEWNDLSASRLQRLAEEQRRLSPTEIEIQKSLNNKVDISFLDRPLAEVMDTLSQLSGVPIHLDSQGLAAEGVTTDTPVTIRLTQQISLKSALNLILEPLRLSYVIQNEVLRVTSEQTKDSNVYAKVYNVADLVIPIPNFLPGYDNFGLPAAIREAHNSLGYGNPAMPIGGRMPLTLASSEESSGASNASVLAQMASSGMLGANANRVNRPMGSGPGGLGNAAAADYDTLIELITSTVSPTSWSEVGGPGAIEPFPTNLSLVVSQTQDVHEEIVDLLEQLRRLQDLQVTIEVRFITLNDNWFERIGIDFDFQINDNVDPASIEDRTRPSAVIGIDEMGPTVNLDLTFTQGSFMASTPAFGGFDPLTAANFGFAILSDIEAFFLLQAAEGDTRTNVLQAPKVTLYNGQLGTVNDFSQRPFVTSLIPVVGDFAAAHQPVIVVLSEGTSLSVQPVVSNDRRFVRLTLMPIFSRIGDVDEFTFIGKTTSSTGTSVKDDEGNIVDRDNETTTTEGSTVQLPTFVSTSVSTTVSVPDGGTILMGGIKRLSEGRNERGVPMLSKIPYVNRLFKNVGIGRQAQSLMMMVTPRIIIQEEEEKEQTGFSFQDTQ